MVARNTDRRPDDKPEPLGKEGTIKHWMFYVFGGLLLGVLLTVGFSVVLGWRTSHETAVLEKQIEKVLSKSILPQLTLTLTKTIDDRFSNLENNKFEPVRKQLSDLQRDVTKLTGDLTNLEKWLPVAEYKAQAKKLGITNPQIIPVSLKPSATFTAIYNFGERNRDAEVQYALTRSEDKFVITTRTKFIENGVVISETQPQHLEAPLSNNRITFNLDFITSSGKVIKTPPITLLILKRTSPSDLILATGFADPKI